MCIYIYIEWNPLTISLKTYCKTTSVPLGWFLPIVFAGSIANLRYPAKNVFRWLITAKDWFLHCFFPVGFPQWYQPSPHIFLCFHTIFGDGSKPWYLVNPKIAGKWMFIPLKCIYRYWPIPISVDRSPLISSSWPFQVSLSCSGNSAVCLRRYARRNFSAACSGSGENPNKSEKKMEYIDVYNCIYSYLPQKK